jgi:enoyl-CoA hydratase/carnithine racemase
MVTKKTKSVRFIKRDGVGILLLNSPKTKNALKSEDMSLITGILQREAQSDIYALIISGEGDVFCAGADLSELVSIIGKNRKNQELQSNDMSKLCDRIQKFPRPTVCALNGSAYGGGVEIACACDFRISVSNIEIIVPPAKIGIHYHPVGIRRFLNIFGTSVTKKLLLTAAKISENELKDVGFFDQIINEGENIIEEAQSFIKQCKELSPEALSGMKMSINDIIMDSVDSKSLDLRIKKALKSQYLDNRLKVIKEKKS